VELAPELLYKVALLLRNTARNVLGFPRRVLSYPHTSAKRNALAYPRRAFAHPISTYDHVRLLVSVPFHCGGELELGERYEANTEQLITDDGAVFEEV
jgi:hypothetical protein